jgi:hypothetical protein
LAANAMTEGLRIRKPDILARHAHDPPAEIERILAGIEHAR